MTTKKNEITVSLKNVSSPAPRWFRKLKKAVTILADTSTIILLSIGYSEESLLILILRVGLSGIFEATESILANGEIYSNAIKQEK